MKDEDAPYGTKQAQIIKAAIAEFTEHGFGPTNMDQVSMRANVSKRTLYKYFESKENLFRGIVERLSAQMQDAFDLAFEPNRCIREQLTELAASEGRLLTSPDTMAAARLVVSETLRNPELAQQIQGMIDKKTTFRNLLKAATEHGQLSVDDPERAAEEFIGLLKARAFWPVLFGAELVTEDEMHQIVENTVEMILSRYGSDQST